MGTHEHVNFSLLRTRVMNKRHLPELYKLWERQYRKAVADCVSLPRLWLDDPSLFAGFIERRLGTENGIVAELDDKIVGFMVCDVFDFHGETTAFFPIMAHAAVEECKMAAYSAMYVSLSRILVERKCINHIVTFFAPDRRLREYLFELGFGLYVVDAYRDSTPVAVEKAMAGIEVRRASGEDLDPLAALVKDSDAYYREAPLFLVREAPGRQTVLDTLASDDQAVFVAVRDGVFIGFMQVRRSGGNDEYTLCDPATCLVDPLGAFIRKEYRGAGIGKRLLHEVVAWCGRKKAPVIHVDFESANLHARRFWPAYFVPLLYSVRRHVNADILMR